MSESTTIRWEQDETGVVTLILDDPGQSANTMNQAFKDSIAAIADRAEAEKDSIRGIIYTSAKKTFFAGGDLKDMIGLRPEHAQLAFDTGTAIKSSLRRIETLGKPVVAAINGAALGGGYEICLASHHRIALDAPGSKIGLPEVTLGLLPAAWRRHPHRAPDGHRGRAAQGPAPGDPVQPPARSGQRPRARTGRHPRGDAGQGPRLHRRQPRVEAAVGRARLQDPGRYAVQPALRRQPPRVPREPQEAAERGPVPGPAQHPGLRRRGRAGGLRDRADHRGPLLHRAGHRTDRQEHDPGVLLRPPGRQHAAAAARRASRPARSPRSPSSAPA